MADGLAIAKDAIRQRCAAFDDAGADFEKLTGELLREFGFFNVRRQNAGTQFGRDFTADLAAPDLGEPTRWFFECKNHRDPITAGHIAPKLMWHFSNERLNGGFGIVGPGVISNELHEVLSRTEFPFSVFNWTDDNFAKLVLLCPATCGRWFPTVDLHPSPTEAQEWREHLLLPAASGYEIAAPLRFEVSPQYEPPHEFAYFLRDGNFEKWRTDFDFKHILTLFNACRWPLIIRSMKVRTISYQPLPERILVQLGPKGDFHPLLLRYTPSQIEGRDVEILAPNMLRLVHRETEAHCLEVNHPVAPGCYELQLVVKYDGNGRIWESHGRPFRLCACTDLIENSTADPGNRLRLHIVRKHYDLLARRLLELPESDWRRINSARHSDALLCLGPTMMDAIERRPPLLQVHSVPLVGREVADDGAVSFGFGETAEVLFDFGSVPDEVLPEDPYDHNERISALYGVPVGQLYGPRR